MVVFRVLILMTAPQMEGGSPLPQESSLLLTVSWRIVGRGVDRNSPKALLLKAWITFNQDSSPFSFHYWGASVPSSQSLKPSLCRSLSHFIRGSPRTTDRFVAVITSLFFFFSLKKKVLSAQEMRIERIYWDTDSITKIGFSHKRRWSYKQWEYINLGILNCFNPYFWNVSTLSWGKDYLQFCRHLNKTRTISQIRLSGQKFQRLIVLVHLWSTVMRSGQIAVFYFLVSILLIGGNTTSFLFSTYMND